MSHRLARAMAVASASTLLLVLLFLVSCGPLAPQTQETLPTDTPMVIGQTPSLACETHTAAAVITATATTLEVGEALTVTVTLYNQGCVALGLPQYRLYIEPDAPATVLAPVNPDPIVHSLGVPPGGSDAAQFRLQAAGSGQASLSATVSFEVHLGYPGPAYWGSASTGAPLWIEVTPAGEERYLSLIRK